VAKHMKGGGKEMTAFWERIREWYLRQLPHPDTSRPEKKSGMGGGNILRDSGAGRRGHPTLTAFRFL